MQRFIRYLYEYEHGKRVRNIGFVKVEKADAKCEMHIHGKSVDFGLEEEVEVFVFYEEGEHMFRVSQGSVECKNPMIHFVLRFEAEDMGGQEAFKEMQGVLLVSGRGKQYVATWDDREIDVDKMTSPREETRPQEEEEEEMQAQEEDEPEAYVQQVERVYEKISRRDLSRLPRKEWRIANNSFLLHGFYNYHHLLYIREGETCWIGVPGIFHEKEQVAARAFGFPQFHRITGDEVELTSEETNLCEDFGYWCRTI